MSKFYKIKNINNDPFDTIVGFIEEHNCRLAEIIEECFCEDESNTLFMFNEEITPDECIELGAEKFATGDGWDAPIEYHLRGDKKAIADAYIARIANGACLSGNFYSFLLGQVIENLPSLEG
jgi:hypothetical protein